MSFLFFCVFLVYYFTGTNELYWLLRSAKKPFTSNCYKKVFMLISDVVSALQCTRYYDGSDFEHITISHVCASDLMSDVLAVEDDHLLLVTSLASDQALRTADIVDAKAVLIVNGKPVHQKMISLAKEFEIPLLGTPLPKFEACIQLGKLLYA